VVEDAACAIGSELMWDGAWRRVGAAVGDVACFSFHPRKLVTTGDGGMLTTDDAALDAKFRRWRQHGMSVPDTVRHGASQVVFEDYDEIGWNYRMTDIQAAVGRVQLGRLPGLIAERRAQAARYRERLAHLPVGLPQEPNWARHNWQSYCIRLPDGAEQKGVMQAMLDQGVATRRGVMCAHREGAYRGRPPRFPLPHSETAQDRCILLPIFTGMTEGQQDQVAEALKGALSRPSAR
jgi:dTDP-4-amino-4,6-dideoxygalactose transaminase